MACVGHNIVFSVQRPRFETVEFTTLQALGEAALRFRPLQPLFTADSICPTALLEVLSTHVAVIYSLGLGFVTAGT